MAWSVRVGGMGSGLAGRGSPCRIKIPDVKASENKMIWLIEEGLSGGGGACCGSPPERAQAGKEVGKVERQVGQ